MPDTPMPSNESLKAQLATDLSAATEAHDAAQRAEGAKAERERLRVGLGLVPRLTAYGDIFDAIWVRDVLALLSEETPND